MRIRSRLLDRVGLWCLLKLVRVLFWTTRTRVRLEVEDTSVYEPLHEPFVYSVWHDSLLVTLFFRRIRNPSAGLVSRHQDGGYVADGMRMLGIQPVRGSTHRGAAKALRELLALPMDTQLCITPDGPRGPRRKVQQGVVIVASRTGRRLIPTAYGCDRGWRVQGNWTDMLVPKPFSTVYLVGGRPIEVPPDLDRAGIAEYTRIVQQAMDDLDDYVNAWIRGEEPELRTDEARAAA